MSEDEIIPDKLEASDLDDTMGELKRKLDRLKEDPSSVDGSAHLLRLFGATLGSEISKAIAQGQAKMDQRLQLYDGVINRLSKTMIIVISRLKTMETKIDTSWKTVLAIGSILTLINLAITFLGK